MSEIVTGTDRSVIEKDVITCEKDFKRNDIRQCHE